MSRITPLFCWTIAATLLVCAPAMGDEEKAAPAAAEEKAPTEEVVEISAAEINQSVIDLDANRFSKRQAAQQKLLDAGKAAIPALVEAATGDSREAKTRAVDILKRLLKSDDDATKTAAKKALEKLSTSADAGAARRAQEALKPKDTPGQLAPGVIQLGGGIRIQVQAIAGKGRRVQIRNVNGVKDIEAEEDGKKIKIHDDPNKGIEIRVTEKVDGKEKTSKYEAKNVDELKKKHPAGYKFYKKYAEGNAGGAIQIRNLQIRPGNLPALPIQPPKIRIPGLRDGDRKEIRERIYEATKQLDEVTRRLKKLSEADEKSDDLKESLKDLEVVKKKLEEARAKLDK